MDKDFEHLEAALGSLLTAIGKQPPADWTLGDWQSFARLQSAVLCHFAEMVINLQGQIEDLERKVYLQRAMQSVDLRKRAVGRPKKRRYGLMGELGAEPASSHRPSSQKRGRPADPTRADTLRIFRARVDTMREVLSQEKRVDKVTAKEALETLLRRYAEV
jgi:hypothetical protein